MAKGPSTNVHTNEDNASNCSITCLPLPLLTHRWKLVHQCLSNLVDDAKFLPFHVHEKGCSSCSRKRNSIPNCIKLYKLQAIACRNKMRTAQGNAQDMFQLFSTWAIKSNAARSLHAEIWQLSVRNTLLNSPIHSAAATATPLSINNLQ